MAQWMGQFSGLTHESKVVDAQDSLRHAVDVLRTAGSIPELENKAKAVHRLAKRLLSARLKLAKARIAVATDVQSGAAIAKRASEIFSLERTYVMVREGGLEAILREFGAWDASLE